MESQSGLELYLGQLELCCSIPLSLPSLFLGLPLPDIGGSVEYIGSHEQRYVRWAVDYCGLESNYAKTLYLLRCDLLHSLGNKPAKAPRDRLLFTFPEFPLGVRIHSITLEIQGQRAVVLDAIMLSKQFLSAGRAWLQKIKHDPEKIFKVERMLRIYPNGISPYIEGQPVIGFGHQN